MSREAMKLALKELVAQTETGLFAVRHDHVAMNDARQAITALREALAEQPAQQEPLEYWNAVEGWVKIDEVREHFDSVGCGTIYKTAGDGRVPLTTAQRKPLTDEELASILPDDDTPMSLGEAFVKFARAIEAAHGIKENT